MDPGTDPPPPDGRVAELEALLDDPTRWPELDPDTLRHLLFYQCVSYGIQPDEGTIPGVMALQRVAVERLLPAVRRQVAVHVARAVERMHREHRLDEGAGCTNALLPFLLEDPDPSVVSVAAAEMALLLPLEQGDLLTGPRYVHALVDEVAGEDAKAGVLAGLLQLGDSRLAPFVANGWKRLGAEGRQTLSLLIQSFQGASRLVVDFLLDWLDDEAAACEAPAFGMVAATLARAGRHAAEHGITDGRRVFPLAASPEGAPFEEVRQLAVADLSPALRDRLLRVAGAERPPSLMTHVLSYWGFDEDAYRLAADAASAAAVPSGALGLCRPVNLELVPEWPGLESGETLLEWGILNPIGPTINTLRLTPVERGAALIYTLYHPARSVSRVMALLAGDDGGAAAACAVLSRNGSDGVWLVRSLPDYVHLPSSSAIDRSQASAAIAAARAAALRAGEEAVPLEVHTDRLRRLAADPWGVTGRELEDARRGVGRPASAAGGGAAGDYRAWLDVAASPAHVAAIRPLMPEAWERLLSQDGDGE